MQQKLFSASFVCRLQQSVDLKTVIITAKFFIGETV